MSKTRKQAMAATREALLHAGMAAFGAEGLDASLDGICRRAGFTRGAFYVHFRDRDDFLVAVMDRVGGAFLQAVFAGGNLPSTVERFVEAIASGAYPLTRKGGVRPHQLLEACARSPVIRARYVALIETSLRELAQMIRRGAELRADVPPSEIASLIMAAVIGAQTMIELGLPLDPPRLARAFMRLLSINEASADAPINEAASGGSKRGRASRRRGSAPKRGGPRAGGRAAPRR
ncbi:MAG TPA: TetR/AcrR family transcriptional regulator [Polyangia bacterium]|nr:TetR/AcrR family transcriptional regulator [Polyangia bacterium]